MSSDVFLEFDPARGAYVTVDDLLGLMNRHTPWGGRKKWCGTLAKRYCIHCGKEKKNEN